MSLKFDLETTFLRQMMFPSKTIDQRGKNISNIKVWLSFLINLKGQNDESIVEGIQIFQMNY